MGEPYIVTDGIISKEKFGKLKEIKGGNLSRKYPYENLVFNGGGAKCIAGIGTLKVFDDLEITPNIKRYAGTSGGALTAAFAAIGYTGAEIEDILGNANMNKLAKDDSWLSKYLRAPVNLFREYGLFHANALERWLGKRIAEKTGKWDLTFEELYKRKGKDREEIELTITAVDITRMNLVFFHKKTAGDFPIVKALRMSMSFPGLFTPVKKKGDDIGMYVDGGLLCNYPIMCFDDWFLSLKRQDDFLYHRGDLYEFFRCTKDSTKKPKPSKETVGVMVYDAYSSEPMTETLDKKYLPDPVADFPKKTEDTKITKLAKGKAEEVRKIHDNSEKLRKLEEALDTLVEAMQNIPHREAATITLAELEAKMEEYKQSESESKSILRTEVEIASGKPEEHTEDQKRTIQKMLMAVLVILSFEDVEPYLSISDDIIWKLFKNYARVDVIREHIYLVFDERRFTNAGDVFTYLGGNSGSEPSVSLADIQQIARTKAMTIRKELQGRFTYDRISNHLVWIKNLIETTTFHVGRYQMHIQDENLERTIGINTGYVKTTDFDMEEGDRNFLVKRGAKATIAFLKNHLENQQK